MRKILLVLCLTSLTGVLFAQSVVPLGYNHAIKSYHAEEKGRKSSGLQQKRLAPPFPGAEYFFFEDFSYYPKSIFPDPTLWEGRSAYINQTYPDSCVSIGVATLDGVDKFGDLYSTANGTFQADTLASVAIDLAGVSDKVYFSFFYQGGGKGDSPELRDSLMVDFYDSTEAVWVKIWDTTGYPANKFEQIVIEIAPSYKTENFKFRFRNLVSTNAKDAPGGEESGVANSDMWHIDYIQVRKANSVEEVQRINDVAFVEPLLSTHSIYHAVPYRHTRASQGKRRSKSQVTIRTLFNNYQGGTPTITVNRVHETYDIYNGKRDLLTGLDPLENEMGRLETLTYTDLFTSNYIYTESQDLGVFEYLCYIDIPKENQYRWNDTVRKIEKYKDYYAFDDGNAEYGFGLPGNGGVNMRLAYRFPLSITKNNPADTLTAIDLHFVGTRNNASSIVEYKLCVWGNNKNKPGELLYPEINDKGELTGPTYTPDSSLAINQFKRIKLEKELVVNDTIYIGLVQTTTGNLGLGYDINSDSKSSIFTNDGNQWVQANNSIPSGSIMMRPVFGNFNFAGTNNPTVLNEGQKPLSLYPNPVKDMLQLDWDSSVLNKDAMQIAIYSIIGKSMLHANGAIEQLDVTGLEKGVYIMIVSNPKTHRNYSYKFIKTE